MDATLITTHALNLNSIHPSWQPFFNLALAKVDKAYLKHLSESPDWLPGPEHIFNAFSLPMNEVHYVLFGESPYPRKISANGYAFWDANVSELWSETGLSKRVNRATSLRNILKMLLIAEGLLSKTHHSQPDIAHLDKTALVQTNAAFFQNFLRHGFLLLNASLVLQDSTTPQKDAKAWVPFITEIIAQLLQHNKTVKFILFGHIANKIEKIIQPKVSNALCVEHPYNHSFITNDTVLDFFRPLHLLHKIST